MGYSPFLLITLGISNQDRASLSRKGLNLNETGEMSSRTQENEITPKNGLSCQNCVKREFCHEICSEVEKLLPKPRSGGHKKEITTDPFKLDSLQSINIIIRGKIVRGKGKGAIGSVVVSVGKRKSVKKGLYSEGYQGVGYDYQAL